MAKTVMGVHACYTRSSKSKNKDLVIVKEKHTDESGNVTNELRFFENFQRDYYITSRANQNHNSKKEWEKISKCRRVKCTQANLLPSVARETKQKIQKGGLRKLNNNPYVYGTDVHVSTILLNKYIEKYGKGTVIPSVGVMDYEWDIKTQSLTVGTYCFGTVECTPVYTTVSRLMVQRSGLSDMAFIKATKDCFNEKVIPVINDYYDREEVPAAKRRTFESRVEIVEFDLEVARQLFKHTHTTQPDFLTFWNGVSDFTIIGQHCEKYSVPLRDMVNDPKVPAEYNNAEFKMGITSTVDANGKPKNKKPHEQWHVLNNMASWQFIDMMNGYASNRAHKPDLPSYGMDAVLDKELGMGKLHFPGLVDEYSSEDRAEWHNVMSVEHVVEYVAYAQFDVIGPLLLEDKNFEIGAQVYSNLTINPITDFKKNPRKLSNKEHFKFLERGFTIGSTGTEMHEELDKRIYSSANWIITLNSSYHDGLSSFAMDDSCMGTLMIPSDNDGDLTSSYPSNQRLLNTSKATTVTEMISVKGIPEPLMRECGLDLISNGGNSLDFMHRIVGMPHLEDILAQFDEDMQDAA